MNLFFASVNCYLLCCIALHVSIPTTDLANTGGHIQRRKSFAKSLRDSVRRFRSRRSTRASSRRRTPRAEAATNEGGASSSPRTRSPVEADRSSAVRLVDENRVDESLLSMVRCLYFAETFLVDSK